MLSSRVVCWQGVLMKNASCSVKDIAFILILTCMTIFREEEDHDDETETGRESSAYIKPDIEELEMLVEAYFVQIDGTLNKLYNVCFISLYSKLGLIKHLHDSLLYYALGPLIDQVIRSRADSNISMITSIWCAALLSDIMKTMSVTQTEDKWIWYPEKLLLSQSLKIAQFKNI